MASVLLVSAHFWQPATGALISTPAGSWPHLKGHVCSSVPLALPLTQPVPSRDFVILAPLGLWASGHADGSIHLRQLRHLTSSSLMAPPPSQPLPIVNHQHPFAAVEVSLVSAALSLTQAACCLQTKRSCSWQALWPSPAYSLDVLALHVTNVVCSSPPHAGSLWARSDLTHTSRLSMRTGTVSGCLVAGGEPRAAAHDRRQPEPGDGLCRGRGHPVA